MERKVPIWTLLAKAIQKNAATHFAAGPHLVGHRLDQKRPRHGRRTRPPSSPSSRAKRRKSREETLQNGPRAALAFRKDRTSDAPSNVAAIPVTAAAKCQFGQRRRG
jgi:hypothetical protein